MVVLGGKYNIRGGGGEGSMARPQLFVIKQALFVIASCLQHRKHILLFLVIHFF